MPTRDDAYKLMTSHVKNENLQQLQFTASEVAEYEYCPLAWWYERFEPMAQANTEELFACLVELEHEHDTQAPTLPEYQMVEQLLVRRGAFEQGQQLHQKHADEVAELEEERVVVPTTSSAPRLLLLTVALVVVALILIVVSLVLR
ncbi:MAG: hypothetical protein JO125_17755 [Chloroflexi bacterium]|nr:hypothetical protein [Ktedonobacteraceae bacterium]MBV9021023.1 hypothetical protein [Ktedonobacteraceae bacterium]MBV9709244.1 hypothetical protein [Chloroflexota bacterium]